MPILSLCLFMFNIVVLDTLSKIELVYTALLYFRNVGWVDGVAWLCGWWLLLWWCEARLVTHSTGVKADFEVMLRLNWGWTKYIQTGNKIMYPDFFWAEKEQSGIKVSILVILKPLLSMLGNSEKDSVIGVVNHDPLQLHPRDSKGYPVKDEECWIMDVNVVLQRFIKRNSYSLSCILLSIHI